MTDDLPNITGSSNISFDAHIINPDDITDEQLEKMMEMGEDLLFNDRPNRSIIFGPENTGKTHFLLDHPEPVILIETEKKRAQYIVGKFRNSEGGPKDVRIFQARNFPFFKRMVEFGIKKLNQEYQETGKIGTLAIDNFSEPMKFARKHYRLINDIPQGRKLNPMLHYGTIYDIHNEVRDMILDCGFNVACSALAKDIYSDPVTDENGKIKEMGHVIAQEDDGQKENKYAFDYRIQTFKKNDDVNIAQIHKATITGKKIAAVEMLDYTKFTKKLEQVKKAENFITKDEYENFKNGSTESNPTPINDTEEIPEVTT